MTLLERLKQVSDAWAAANDRSLARLATIVVNDGSFFTRLASDKPNATTATLIKFAQFFADPANWPDGHIPSEAVSFVHVNGLSVPEGAAATGQGRNLSGYATTALTGGDYMTRGVR